MAFLTTAGYRLHAAYRGQFVKALHYVFDCFLSDLHGKADPDARAVMSR